MPQNFILSSNYAFFFFFQKFHSLEFETILRQPLHSFPIKMNVKIVWRSSNIEVSIRAYFGDEIHKNCFIWKGGEPNIETKVTCQSKLTTFDYKFPNTGEVKRETLITKESIAQLVSMCLGPQNRWFKSRCYMKVRRIIP